MLIFSYQRFLLIALGAILGANARYLVGLIAAHRFGMDLPYGTLIANVTGCLLLGFVVTLQTEWITVSPQARLLIGVGFLGSYTTFSSYAVESVLLIQEGAPLRGLANILANNALGIFAAWLGILLARWIG